MNELTSRERLQPSLLDRLTDEEPGNPSESADKRVLSLTQLKASVLRDLAWLFNTSALLDPEDGTPMQAASSVINYGLPALAGQTASSVDIQRIERLLCEAICAFEPRILRTSLRVKAQLGHEQMNHNALSFEIEGDLWAQPMPLRLLLKTELDLETGHVQVVPNDARRRA